MKKSPNILSKIVGMALKFYTDVAKGLKIKVRKFLGLIPTFADVGKTGKLGLFAPPPHPE